MGRAEKRLLTVTTREGERDIEIAKITEGMSGGGESDDSSTGTSIC